MAETVAELQGVINVILAQDSTMFSASLPHTLLLIIECLMQNGWGAKQSLHAATSRFGRDMVQHLYNFGQERP